MTASNGSVIVSASEAAAIDSTATATAIGVAAGFGGATGFSGGGASATNLILGTANAFISNADVFATGTDPGQGMVSVTTDYSSSIDSLVAAAAVSVAIGTGTTPGIAIGASFAQNLIGWTTPFTRDPVEAKAYIEGSDVTAGLHPHRDRDQRRRRQRNRDRRRGRPGRARAIARSACRGPGSSP